MILKNAPKISEEKKLVMSRSYVKNATMPTLELTWLSCRRFCCQSNIH